MSRKFKKNLTKLISDFEMKLEFEYKMFEMIKEENRLKYNYPIINLSSLRLNNDNLKNSLNDINSFFNQDLFGKIFNIFKASSWEFSFNNPKKSGEILTSVFSSSVINFLHNNLIQQKSLVKAYLSSEPGIDYEEAIRNKSILKEMVEKENNQVKDKENFKVKLNEYEEDLKKLREQVLIQQNDLDVCHLKLLQPNKEKTSEINFLENQTENKSLNTTYPEEEFSKYTENSCSLNELIYSGINLSELPKEILSDDVHSGKQRSSFKLTDKDNRPIPLTKFKVNSNDVSEDISVLYHRKILEKIQKYTAKIKNIDVKVMANIQSEEIRKEYDEKFDIFKKEYIKEIEELNEQIKNLKIHQVGYTENIEFLTNVMVDYEGLKEYVSSCKTCSKHIRPIGNK